MSLFYFYSATLLLYFIFLNLFIAVIIQGFLDSKSNEKSRVKLAHLEQFRTEWKKIDPNVKLVVKIKDLFVILKNLGSPLGLSTELKFRDRLKFFNVIHIPLI